MSKSGIDDKSPRGDSADKSAGFKRKDPEWFEIDDSRNTYVYVEGLPKTITEEEFIDLMKKYGIIKKKAVMGNPFNIKLYRHPDGTPKGDGMCCYERVESVDLAIKFLNEYIYDKEHTLKCSRGQFQLKGSYDPSKKPRIDKRAKLKHKKTAENLLSWEPKLKPEIKQKRVILKNMFTLEEILEDTDLLLFLKEEVEEKCSELGIEAKKIDIYDKHPDGVIAVTFPEFEQAQSCIKALDNMYYAGRIIKADLWDGKTKYRIKETEDEVEERIKKWHQHIENSDAEQPETSSQDKVNV